MFRTFKALAESRRHRRRQRRLRRIARDLPPHLMRDIGLDPWPDQTPDIRHQFW